MMKSYFIAALVLILVAIIPVVMIAKTRAVKSSNNKIHLIPDMDHQPKYKAQSYNPNFADKRAMRPQVVGTVARGHLQTDQHFYQGKVNGEWATTLPMPVTDQLLQRGRDRYEIYCGMCHGLAGYGDGIINQRAERLQEGTWVQPSSYHTELVRDRPDGHIFNTITNGIRNMAPYGHQIPPADRWAIVAYIRALQKSQNASVDEVPAEYRDDLR